MSSYTCRCCGKPLFEEVIDLGFQPPSNAYLTCEQVNKPEINYPLKVFVCNSCWLLQIPEYAKPTELFRDDYSYFSRTSSSWCKHAENFVNQSISKLNLDKNSLVVEIACNDGYLLQYVAKENIPCLGIEPANDVAQVAIEDGIEVITRFFNKELADEIISLPGPYKNGADLIVANNVFAHIPDINNFVEGLSKLLKNKGLISIEFPHLLNLVRENQFDTIYHEHYSYLSLNVVEKILANSGLEVIEVEELKSHGGSLRVWCAHKGVFLKDKSIDFVLAKEKQAQLESIKTYYNLQDNAIKCKNNLLQFLIEAKKKDKKIIGYGAAAKGNTLLNFAGIKKDLLSAVADKAKRKQGKYLPGSHIKIISLEELEEINFDSLLVLPWNLIREIRNQITLQCDLITAIPELKVYKS